MASGIFHTTYQGDMALRPLPIQRWRLFFVVLLAIAFPFAFQDQSYYLLLANQSLIAAIGAIGLNILVGFTGQISLGQGAFMAVGAYTSALLAKDLGVSWVLSIPLGALASAGFGILFGIPSLRLKGLYLAIATLSAQEIVHWFITIDPFRFLGQSINVPRPDVFGQRIDRLFGQRMDYEFVFYWVILICTLFTVLAAANLFRSRHGRAFIAIRDQDIAASVMGLNPFGVKLTAFAVSSFFVGLSGALLAFHSRIVTWERFTVDVSILYLAMIIIGGLGSISGSIYGAIFLTLLPAIITNAGQSLQGSLPGFDKVLPYVQQGVFGLIIVLFLVFEPQGLAKIWRNLKDYFRLWPFSY